MNASGQILRGYLSCLFFVCLFDTLGWELAPSAGTTNDGIRPIPTRRPGLGWGWEGRNRGVTGAGEEFRDGEEEEEERLYLRSKTHGSV